MSNKRTYLKSLKSLLAVILLSFTAVGCVQNTMMYRWNAYESLTYDMYVNPGKADPDTQIVKLTEEIEKTYADGKKVPPGLHAHLGYMHFLKNDHAAAEKSFLTEKELFPESATFVDGLLMRMKP